MNIPYITKKTDGTILLTAPVMIPGQPDCDYNRGEPPLTRPQVKEFMKSYEKYQFVDHEHELTRTGRKRGHKKESYLLTEPTPLELYDGSIMTYPKGTWVMTSHITDPLAIANAEKGEYTGYSVTVRSREVADKYLELIRELDYREAEALKSNSLSGLIKDVPDAVVLSVSLVKKPCQSGSKICKIKHGDIMSDGEIKSKVLSALGMSEAADVESLKSEVSSISEELEALKKDTNESLKSMKDEIISEFKNVLVEFADKSKEDEEEDDEEEEVEDEETTETSEEIEDEEEDDEEGEEDKKPHADKGSKQGKIHNGSNKSQNTVQDTYEFLGRLPDGTRKSYDY